MLKNPQLRKTVKFTVITKKQQSQLPTITQPQSTKILNLLNVPLTQDEIDILNLGLPFTPTPKQNIAEFQNDIFQFTRKLHWPTITKTATLLMNLLLKITSATKRYLLKICHLRHRLRIFLFHRKVMFRSQNIQVFVFLTMPWFTKFVTSWWVLVHETGCNFWIYLLNHNLLSHQTWPIDRDKQGQKSSGIIWTIWRTGAKFQVLFHIVSCSHYLITNHLKVPRFDFFEKANKVQLKMVNVN